MSSSGAAMGGNGYRGPQTEEEEEEEMPIEKCFNGRKVVLISKEEYEVEVQGMEGNGVIYCVFDSDDDRGSYHLLTKEFEKFFQHPRKREHYRQSVDHLMEGEICITQVRKRGFPPAIKNPVAFELQRVRVVKIDKETCTAIVEGIDVYGRHEVKIEELFYLREKFMNAQTFMVKCQLAGMKLFKGTDLVSNSNRRSPFPMPFRGVMQVLKSEDQDDLPVVTVIKLEDVGMVTEICRLQVHILKHLDVGISLSGTEACKIPCTIVHINKNGNVGIAFKKDEWLRERIADELLKLLPAAFCLVVREELRMERVLEILTKRPKTIFVSIRKIGDEAEDVEIKRVKVIEMYPPVRGVGELLVNFIDDGRKERLKTFNIFPIEPLSRALNFIPPLAMEGHLEYVKHTLASVDDIKTMTEGKTMELQVIYEWPKSVHPPEFRVFVNLLPTFEFSIDDLSKTVANISIDFGDSQPTDYKLHRRKFALSSATLSGLLVSNGLAQPYTKADLVEQEAEKIRVCNEML